MKGIRFSLAVCAISMIAGAVFGQNLTNVTGTVYDPNRIPYANATITFTLGPLPFSSQPTLPTTPATPVAGTQGPFALDSNGTFSINLPSNAAITPASTQWTATVCPSTAMGPSSIFNGAGCFAGAALTISGSSQDISLNLDTAAAALAQRFNSAVVYKTLPAAGTASIGATTMITAPAIGSGGTTYRFSAYLSQTILGASCAGNSTIVVNVVYQDANAASPQTQAVGTFTVTTNGTLGIVPLTTNTWMPMMLHAGASTPVKFSTTYTAGGSCSPAPTVQVYPRLEIM